jgi:hypothetical protein
MSVEFLAAVAQIVAAIGVIVSLIYVGVQILRDADRLTITSAHKPIGDTVAVPTT